MAPTESHEDTFRQRAEELADRGEYGKAQVCATLALVAAVEERTTVVRLLAPATEPDPDAGTGYTEFELDPEAEAIELAEEPSLDIELDD